MVAFAFSTEPCSSRTSGRLGVQKVRARVRVRVRVRLGVQKVTSEVSDSVEVKVLKSRFQGGWLFGSGLSLMA